LRAKIPIGLLKPRRYVCFRADRIGPELRRELRKAVMMLFGASGAADMRALIREIRGDMALMETTNVDLPKALSALFFALRSMGSGGLRVIKVSGTIKKAMMAMKEALEE